MKAENTPRERNNRSNNSFGSLCKRREIKKNTFKRCRCAKGHIDITKTKKFVYKRNRLITASILRLCGATSARQRCSSSAAGCLTALSRRPYFVSSACLSERRVTSRTFCILKVHVIACRSKHPTTTNEEKTSVKKIYYKHIINKQKYTNKVEE